MTRVLLLLITVLALSLQANAKVNAKADGKTEKKEYAVKVDIDKKIIYVHRLGLPESTTIQEVLNIMPEILSRPGSFLVTNYVIKIEDLCVDDASDAVLKQLRIADVEKIEVQESPIDTYNHNGEGGSINIILADPDSGLAGNVSLDGGYQPDVMGGVNLSYKTDNGWRLHGLFKSEYYDPTEQTIDGGVAYADVTKLCDYGLSESVSNNGNYNYKEALNDRFVGQMARLYARHTTKRSSLELAFGEDNSYSKSISGIDKITKKKVFTFLSHAKYDYTFEPGSQLTLKADYQYTPTNNWQNTIPNAIDETTKQNMFSSQIEYVQPIIKMFYASLNLKFGANINYFWTYRPNNWKEKTFHVMPYFNVEGHVNNWKFQLEAEFQNYNYRLTDKEGISMSTLGMKDHNDFTGLFGIAYQFTPNQQLKFVADRKIQRQDSYSLNPMKLNEVQVDYIINHTTDVESWVLNLGAGYIYANNIMKSVKIDSGSILFDNNNNILHADVMGLYQRGIFSVALTGNVYSCKMNYKNWETNKYTYYNISVLPSLNFKKGIHVALRYVHNSPISQLLTKNGACNYLRMIIGKDFGHWDFHLYGQLNLNKYKETTYGYYYTNNSMLLAYETYQSYTINSLRNSIGIGVRYKF